MKKMIDLTFILDRSTSMLPLVSSTLKGFNDMIEEQKGEDSPGCVSLFLFDTGVENPYNAVPIENVKDLDEEQYRPQGFTAMNDAIAMAINSTGERLRKMKEKDRPSDVVIAIITDGQENSSREFGGNNGRRKVQEMIKHQEDKYNWQFLFLGANINVEEEAHSRGIIDHGSMLTYSATDKGMDNMYGTLSNAVLSKRRSMKGGQSCRIDLKKENHGRNHDA